MRGRRRILLAAGAVAGASSLRSLAQPAKPARVGFLKFLPLNDVIKGAVVELDFSIH